MTARLIPHHCRRCGGTLQTPRQPLPSPSFVFPSLWRWPHRSPSSVPFTAVHRRFSSTPSVFPSTSPPSPPVPPTPILPSSPPSAPLDPLWLYQLTELRVLLHYPLPTLSSLFLLIHRFLTSFASQLLPSDLHLLIHHLALHQRDEGQLHSITALALRLYDEYIQREGWPPLPGPVMRDLLTLTSRAGEVTASIRLLERMEQGGYEGVGVSEYNLVLWATRHVPRQRFDWWRAMWEKSLSSPFIDAESLLVSLHAHVGCGKPVPLRFYAWLASRDEAFLLRCLTAPAGTASPLLPLLMSQLYSFVDQYLSTSAVQHNVARVIWEMRHRFGAEFNVPADFEWGKTVQPHLVMLTLYRITNTLGVPLPSTALRQLSYRVEQERRRLVWKIESPSPKPGEADAASIHIGLLCAGLRSELRVRSREVEGEGVKEMRKRHLPWQAVLAAYDQKVSKGVAVTLADSLEAIVACYRGQHWQRAVELLVMPLYTQLQPEEVEGLVTERSLTVHPRSIPSAVTASPSPAVDNPSTSSTPADLFSHDEADYIDLSPITGQWTGPQSHRIDFPTLLQNFSPRSHSWGSMETDSPPSNSLPPQADNRLMEGGEAEAQANPSHFSSPRLLSSPSAGMASPVLGMTVLHFAFCIAAMDEAANAESITKADRLHSIALLHFPFLLHLYEPTTSTIHLVHPTIAGNTASSHLINAFVFAPHRAKDRLWALLYFVWRILRRFNPDRGTDRVTASPVTAQPLWQLEQHYLRTWGRASSSAAVRVLDGGERGVVNLRVEREEEVRLLRRMLRDEPWGMGGGGENEQWPSKVLKVGDLMSSFKRKKLLGERNEAFPGAAKMPGWESGWTAMFSHIEHEDIRLPCLQIPAEAWEECVQR